MLAASFTCFPKIRAFVTSISQNLVPRFKFGPTLFTSFFPKPVPTTWFLTSAQHKTKHSSQLHNHILPESRKNLLMRQPTGRNYATLRPGTPIEPWVCASYALECTLYAQTMPGPKSPLNCSDTISLYRSVFSSGFCHWMNSRAMTLRHSLWTHSTAGHHHGSCTRGVSQTNRPWPGRTTGPQPRTYAKIWWWEVPRFQVKGSRRRGS